MRRLPGKGRLPRVRLRHGGAASRETRAARAGAWAAALLVASLGTQVAWPATGLAQVTRLQIQDVESPALDGRSFGGVGRYERLRLVAYGAVDPDDPRHADIVNLDLAPRNAAGRVEYGTTVEIYRPTGWPVVATCRRSM